MDTVELNNKASNTTQNTTTITNNIANTHIANKNTRAPFLLNTGFFSLEGALELVTLELPKLYKDLQQNKQNAARDSQGFNQLHVPSSSLLSRNSTPRSSSFSNNLTRCCKDFDADSFFAAILTCLSYLPSNLWSYLDVEVQKGLLKLCLSACEVVCVFVLCK